MFLSTVELIGTDLWCLCLVAGALLSARTLIHWFQLESYQFPGYFRTLRRQGLRGWIPGACLATVVLLTLLAGRIFRSKTSWLLLAISGLVLIATGYGLLLWSRKQKEKKKLVFTPRVKRLYIVCAIVWTLVFMTAFFLLSQLKASLWINIGLVLLPLLLPLWIALGGLIAWPIEKGISEIYFRDAQRILRERPDLIRIGITGSWGKTSVKFILGALLSEKYPTLVTPASFNTPMGVTKVIRTQLEPGYRVFVAEMGARHVGDIKEMCRLVHPHIGLLTSVGPQHLDTFHTQERITKTKYELMEAIPEDGTCFFADDDGIVTELWAKTRKEKFLTGLNSKRDDVWVEDLQVSPSGSHFLLCTAQERIPCETELLGELNIRNIVLCASVCLKLGLNGREIARGIRKLKPVEHRLELKRNPGGFNVLDDAFNSNIRGAKQAFQTLKQFPGRRLIVTPGMVELGDQEAELNREFGQAMADCCDEVILVGKKRSEALRQGLSDQGFPKERIHVVGSLSEAAQLLGSLVHPGDTVLFENDLPDNYSEE
ncbi:MAG: UDP-N-acetylmuramoyl-tripeptide--D-alanyl-D-alanine ligase [Clostridia bacterium]|nr:UDP-N-acetylmuramoyl-tripeptide--D-alanyl-D-alanine ligase [Clostridia bacterium]